ncbi:T-cell activation inhibitor, mitochondrial-like [Phthorimaea operculella]|nr:T-cell activation inhibitor, mitochondrial-like [Phthorimaea operculella]
MYSRVPIRVGCSGGLICRFLSSAEISTALRPFYFSVHPDLFGKYPEQRKINEYSLQQLSALLEAQQSSRRMTVPPLSFYLRQKDKPEGNFKLVTIKVNGGNVRETVINVLKSCDMETTYIDKIPRTITNRPEFNKQDFSYAYEKYNTEFEKVSRMKRKVEERKAIDNVVDWINENSREAKTKYESTSATRNQVNVLIEDLCKTYGIKKVKYDTGWNISHIRGALQSLVSLAEQHSKVMKNLEGRTIALGQFTGVSLDGDVYLNIIDVRNEWLSLIKKVSQEDSALTMIPIYEKTLSSILRNIHIRRRKFMPKVSATQYCSHLRQLITSIGDFYGKGRKIPDAVPESLSKYEIVVEPKVLITSIGDFYGKGRKIPDAVPESLSKYEIVVEPHLLRQLITSIGDFYGKGRKIPDAVPESLSKYEIVVEPEAGPLMVSPTGQFITPSSCPAEELVKFIANHLDDATLLLTEYSINKHVEKALFKEVKERFGLLELHKDDSITPALMILCCQRLLTRIDKLDRVRKHNHNHTHNSPLLDMALFKQVKERFGLLELHKDDSITPALMILCCQRLLTRIDKLDRERFGLLELHKDDSITPELMILCCQRLLTRIDKLDRVREVSMKQVASVNQWTFATFKEEYAVLE